MTLYFAYGSNMDRAGMAERCPAARPIGVAKLVGWRFIVSVHGYASIVSAPGGEVVGILWRLSARDRAALDTYESLDSGLYMRRQLAVVHDGAARLAMVYVGRGRLAGRPRPGVVELIVAAAREWQLPVDYIRSLQRWLRPAPGIGVRV